MSARLLAAAIFAATAAAALADGPADNLPDKVRRVPPPGIKIPDADREELTEGVKKLGDEIASLRASKSLSADRYLPDVEIFHKAVHWALIHDEFYDVKEVPVAKALLKQGFERAAALKDGKHPWTTQTGLVARGYRSDIDGSVQPYGVFVPASFKPEEKRKYRLDFWCHGRGEKLTELAFINGVQKNGTEFKPDDHFLIQLYGRYCNANKFAGEIDCFEVLTHAMVSEYPIDPDRVVMRGFSMGGAAAWQFAVHYPDMWCAAAPGAGFSETADFLKVFQNEAVKPTWYEQKLWRWYDCTEYAGNLANLPLIAYSGEIDKQKQAADMMVAAARKEGLEFPHVIGPKTAHKYEPEAKKKINAFVDAAAEKGLDSHPKSLRFVTYTLRYHSLHWLRIDGLEKHWERAEAKAEVEGDTVRITTSGITGLTIRGTPYRSEGEWAQRRPYKVVLDGQEFPAVHPGKGVATHTFVREAGKWRATASETGIALGGSVGAVPPFDPAKLRKKHGLQGPIDDAFLSSFVFVKPTGTAMNETVGKFAEREYAHAVEHWRRQFRGDARTKTDKELTDEDIAAHNLVLFGDPSSNAVLAKIADKLPVKWTAEGVKIGDKTYTSDKHVPVLIYPNPLNPDRYVVLNSGFTFREYDYLNNARQVPKLPDWAVIDASTPMTSRGPGVVVDADFFGEKWELLPPRKP
jgi:pimeloyl-ACP methyl ester carboxylesterase